VRRLQKDLAWKDILFFNEYFHGDNGAGINAAYQSGWTALVVELIPDPPRRPAVPRLGSHIGTRPSRPAERRTHP
jgi:hypothetical protein